MGTEANKSCYRRWFEEVINQRRGDLVDELLTADYRLHFPGMPPVDADGHRLLLQGFLAGFEDWREQVDVLVAEGDRVVAWVTGTGTHTGDFQGIPATGRRVRVTGVGMGRIADGRIAEAWACFDALGMLQQLGAAPEPVPAG